MENYNLNVKSGHPRWGARKIHERLVRTFSGIKIPAKSTIHAVLDRMAWWSAAVTRGMVRRAPFIARPAPNELWCTDYKGEFLLGNHHYCYPLTVTDHASRYVLT